MWHDYHDNIAPRCIEWASQAMVKAVSPGSLVFSFYKERQTLLHQLLLARGEIWTLKPQADLIIRQQDLIGDMENMMKLIAGISIRWRDMRSKSKGYRVKLSESTWGDAVRIQTGARCTLCHPPPLE